MHADLESRPVSKVDSKILQLADARSPEDISMMMGGIVSPAFVASRTQVLLKEAIWLTNAQQLLLNDLKLRNILLTLEGQFMDMDNLKLQVAVIKELGARLEKRITATKVDLNTYDKNIGAEMGRIVDSAMSYMQGALRDKVDPVEWANLKAEALLAARAEIMKNEIED